MVKTKAFPEAMPTQSDLAQIWQEALLFWSPLAPSFPVPEWHSESQSIQALHLEQDLARVHLHSHRVLLNGPRLTASGLLSELPVILAHEAGHLLFSPASVLVQGKSIEILQGLLPGFVPELPHLVNLWQDLLINQRLFKQFSEQLPTLVKALCPNKPTPLWQWILRGYEYLWSLAPGSLTQPNPDPCLEGDASELADLILAFQSNDLGGLPVFAQLCQPYLHQENRPWRLQEGTVFSLPSASWPSQEKPSMSPAPQTEALPTWSLNLPKPMLANPCAETGQNLYESPQDWHQFWIDLGLPLAPESSTQLFYREKAIPLLMPWKIPLSDVTSESLPEGLKPWLLDAPIQEIAWVESLLTSPRIVPGLTTVKQRWSREQEKSHREVRQLDLYLDASGSLPNPFLEMAPLVLTGVVLALSALRQGWSVRVTLWSGNTEPLQTLPFTRSEKKLLQILTHYLGGSTRFPLELFTKRYSSPQASASHLCLLSDQGLLDSLEAEQGLQSLAQALQYSQGGGSLFLQWPKAAPPHRLFAQLETLGWSVYPLQTESDIRVATQTLFGRMAHV